MSYGNGCAYENGVYTSVAAFRDWIEEEAGPSCEDAEDWHKTDEPEKDCQWVRLVRFSSSTSLSFST